MLLYDKLAPYYYFIESKHRNILNDVSLIRHYAKGISKPDLLDIGCGSGEHCSMLYREGFTCTGIDNSPRMIEVATERNGKGPKYQILSMTDFDFFEEFDIATCLFGSFDYLLDNEEIDKTLWNTWRALRSGGVAIFEIWNAVPLVEILSKPLSPVSTTYYNGVKIERERGFHLLESSPRVIVEVNYHYHYSGPEGLDLLEDVHRMRAYRIDEISTIITRNGFQIRDVFASAYREKFHDYSNKMIIAFEKE